MASAPERGHGDDGTQRFSTRRIERAGQLLIVLDDGSAGSSATLAPGLGFSCVSFRVATPSGAWAVLSEPPDDAALVTRTMRHGIPILFPWPNRVAHGRFSFDGASYQLPVSSDSPHANHGLARERAWTVEAHGARANGAFCRASVEIGRTPDDAWPFPVGLTVEYRLAGSTLAIEARAQNIGSALAPVGFGLHPWFDLPLGPGGSREATEIHVPAAAHWQLDQLIPTGRVAPVAGALDRRAWAPLGDVLLDDVFTDLDVVDGWFTAEVRDPASGRAVVVRSDRAFRQHVVYAPHIRSTLCLEPYTCATDAMNLAARGIDAGLVVLAPGETCQGTVEIVARA